MTLLCVPIFVTNVEQTIAAVAQAAENGADLVELRIDAFTNPAAVAELVSRSTLPCLVTCRPEWEGGQSDSEDVVRLAALNAAVEAGAAYVDVELKTLQRAGTPAAPRMVVSSHDFTGRPARLANLVLELSASPATVNKIVWTARSIRDNLEAFELLQTRVRPTVALCMGEAGLVSRVLAKKFGAFLTFAALDARSGTAPGQVSIADMKRLYRWDAIKPTTKVYGVVASPVMHSMSPAIHNAAFDATGYDGVYLPLLVNPGYESFKAFMESFVPFAGVDLSGLSVTLPHKENALRYLKERGGEIEPLAEQIGAANTIAIERSADGVVALRGTNTDYAAILDSIADRLGGGRAALAGRRVGVIGAGGTGRTAVAGLARYGATVVVYNRTADRAEALAREFDGRGGKVVAAAWEKLPASCCDVFVQTTSLGMHPSVDASAFDGGLPALSADSIVFDTVYNPIRTKLLAQAEAAGARPINGVEMFVRQAAAQFEAWTNLPAPRDVMRAVVERRLRGAER